MKKFIGREPELKKLEKEYGRDSSFLVVYGRRRVGKTTLIKEFIKDKEALYFLASTEMEVLNRNRFLQSLAAFTGKEHLKNSNYDNWYDVFKLFLDHKPGEKKILVIDEFQYLVNSNEAFTSIFQNVWDEMLKNSNIMVILCGSYISMMTSQVLAYSSPLYGRRTAQIKLNPLGFREVSDYFGDRSFKSMVDLYSVTGGVPKYLEFFDNEDDMFEVIEEEILDQKGFLYEEPVFLLEKEVKETMTYFSIIHTIAKGNHKLSKIASSLEMASTSLSPYLKILIELNLLEKRVPVTEKNPDKSRKGLYFIADNFIEFWFKFVYPYKSELEIGNKSYVVDRLKNNFVDNHASFVYEDICRDLLVRKAKDLGFVINRIGSYWDAHNEIDIVAVDKENKILLIGECKYMKKSMSDSIFFNLIKKAEGIKGYEDYVKAYVLFSMNGFDDRLVELEKERNDLILFE
jgi:hypothetical protein